MDNEKLKKSIVFQMFVGSLAGDFASRLMVMLKARQHLVFGFADVS